MCLIGNLSAKLQMNLSLKTIPWNKLTFAFNSPYMSAAYMNEPFGCLDFLGSVFIMKLLIFVWNGQFLGKLLAWFFRFFRFFLCFFFLKIEKTFFSKKTKKKIFRPNTTNHVPTVDVFTRGKKCPGSICQELHDLAYDRLVLGIQ